MNCVFIQLRCRPGRTYEVADAIYDREFASELYSTSGEYDLIMLNHSLEHMTEPTEALVQVGRLLAPAGWVMVRLPVAGGYGWKTYREHWFGLEAPRHLVLPSADGMQRIAARAGFAIVKTVYDGHGGYYAMGESAKRALPMDGPRRPARRGGVYFARLQAKAAAASREFVIGR